jgi:hypothetical protein
MVEPQVEQAPTELIVILLVQMLFVVAAALAVIGTVLVPMAVLAADMLALAADLVAEAEILLVCPAAEAAQPAIRVQADGELLAAIQDQMGLPAVEAEVVVVIINTATAMELRVVLAEVVLVYLAKAPMA